MKTIKTIAPYDHDCEDCQWVGWFWPYADKPPFNVYLCQGETVIIRQSSEPSDYWSATGGTIRKGPIGFHE